ncbi:hypothetical protein LBMAG56_45650 [Verrucomicrobiota bacterium]|nr:hypothetical protein LBMAG56_45650 [Verrucomicrobiota bacterium]
MSEPQNISSAAVIAAMRHWVERAVIGLNLCPFAKAVHLKGQIRYVVSEARTQDALLAELKTELQFLHATPAEQTDNTLLIHPQVLTEFTEFKTFLPRADAALRRAGLIGEIQIANFHPQYQFADSEPDDPANYTNRAPYPTLHLLREASLDRAVQAFPDAALIYERNIATLTALGHAGWEKLQIKPAAPGAGTERKASPPV